MTRQPLPGPGVRPPVIEWTTICRFDQLLPERGVAALLGDAQVAVFRTFDGQLHALANCDPFTGACVISRGIVGSRGDRATVASPLHKQVFDLASGVCLDDPAVRLAVYQVQVRDGLVEVGHPEVARE